jgi:hypothetical protein
MAKSEHEPEYWVGLVEPRKSAWVGFIQTVATGVLTGVGTAVAILLMTPILQNELLTPPSCDNPVGLHVVADVTASGDYRQEAPGYPPENVLDGNTATAWVENGPDLGLGESLTLTVPPDTDLQLICVVNGYAKEEAVFNRNAVVRQFDVSTDRGEHAAMLRPRTVQEMGTYESVDFKRGVTSTVKLTLRLAAAGNGSVIDADTAISEIELWASD